MGMPELPTPRPTSGTEIPTGWTLRLYHAVESMRDELRRIAGGGRNSTDRRFRSVGIASVTAGTLGAAATGDVYTATKGEKIETASEIRTLQGDPEDAPAGWQIVVLLDWPDGQYWTSIRNINDDRYAAVNSADVPDYLEEQFHPMTEEQSPSAVAGVVDFEVVDQSGDKKIIGDVRLDAGGAYGLERDNSIPAAPTLRLKVNDTQADYAPQIAIFESGGTYVVRIRSKKGYNAINAQGELQHYAGDYGAWSSVGACPDVSEIEGGTP